jgi:Rrf2 family protein
MISLSAQYALRAIVHIAGSPGMHTADSIASQTGIPRGYLAKILQRLHQCHLLDTQRGLGGGYALTKAPESMCVMDVVRAIDPREDLSMCRDCHTDECQIVAYLRSCAEVWDDMLKRKPLSEFLSDCTRKETGP